MKRLTIWCLLAFLGLARAAAESQWIVGVERASLSLAPFQSDRESRLPVEHIRQKGPTCLSTAAAIALRYYGTAIEPGRIYELGKWDSVTGKRLNFTDGSTFEQLMSVLKPMNYHWFEADFAADKDGFRQGMVKIHEQVALGYPVIVGAYFGDGEGHAVLVYGYDDLAEIVHVLDSALPPPGKRVMTCDEFEMVWNLRVLGFSVRMAMFTLPKGEYPPASVLPASPATDETPLPELAPEPSSPPSPPPRPAPPVGPEKVVVVPPRAGGFQAHGAGSPARARGLPNIEQTASGTRVPLTPFLPVTLKPFLP